MGYAGDVPNAIAEREALLEDVTIVSSLAILLILGWIVLFFARSWRSCWSGQRWCSARPWRLRSVWPRTGN